MSINTTLAKWDFLAFSMYKWVSKAFVWKLLPQNLTIRYVGMIVCLLMGLISGTVYYATLAYSAAALALFLFRTLHLRVEPEVAWAAFFILNTFSPWSGTRGGEPWKEETLASVYLGRLDLKYLLLMYHFFSSKAGSLLWCGGWHILWYRPGQTDEMIYILHSHSSQKNWQERDWSARPSHVKVITSKTTMFAFQCL